MRLFLTSNGFPEKNINSRQEFFELAGKPVEDIKVAFIPTASEVEEDRSFMLTDRKEIEEMGIPKGNITDLLLDKPITLDELKGYDVIFVDGGNTFYLLQKVRESGFDKALEEYLKQDLGVYVGVSAGTVLMGPEVDFVDSWDDKSKASLTNTKGLGYVKERYSPHYVEEEKEILDKWRETTPHPIVELRDGEAVLVVNEKSKTIRG